jgi:hypothetical protein
MIKLINLLILVGIQILGQSHNEIVGPPDPLITWPDNFTISVTNIGDLDDLLDPDNLIPPYDKPIVMGHCSEGYNISHMDQYFVYNICRKYLRHWTVIDWCQYSPNSHPPTGIWTYTQIITVYLIQDPISPCDGQ